MYKNLRRSLGVTLAMLLVSSMLAGGTTFAPTMRAAAANAATAPTNTVTSAPATTTLGTATLTITPTVANHGGLVTVSGTGFAPNEAVLIYFTRSPKSTTTATADANGNLPPTGVTVPYNLTPGKHTLNALGTTTRHAATRSVLILALTSSIIPSTTTASPNDTVTVTGKGFATTEQVTLAFNGTALTTIPAVITTNGAFTATFATPGNLLSGANTLSAVGNESRVSAVTALTARLPVATQFYFAGGLNTTTEHSSIDLLNSHGAPAIAYLTFYFANGATDTKTVTVNPTAETVIAVATLESVTGPFGLAIQADRQIAAQITISRDGEDGDNLLGNSGLDTTWYLAEGYTGLTFQETVSILNPDATTPAHVLLHRLLFGGVPGKDVRVTVAAHSSYAMDINSQMPHRSLSIMATSDRPVVLERTLTFSNNRYGMTTSAGSNTPATSWIFAEGTTVNRFQTFLTILNPGTAPALVTASFFGRTGGALGSKTILVSGNSRANLKLNDLLNASGIATVVTSNRPVVLERPEYFGSPNDAGIAGSDVFGRNGAGVRWSFPGGNTQGTDEYLLLYNPSPLMVTVDATFYTADGATITKRVRVPPTVRYNIDVNTLLPGFAPIHGAALQSANMLGFVAEQTVFAPDHSTLRSTQGRAQ